MLGGVGGTEIILILLVIIIFFGADKIPELARGMGKGMQEFQKASDSIQKEINQSKNNFSNPPEKQKADTSEKEEAIEEEVEAKEKTNIEKDKSKNK